MTTIKKIKIGTGVVLILIIALFFHYNLPRTAVVQISGTDIKRMDKTKDMEKEKDKTDGQVKSEPQTTDVRFVNSVSRKGKPMVFKNVDTGWGWPPYFKFNSANLTAKAQAFATDPNKPWVLVKYYGWRLTVFSMFPNALSLKQVDRNYTHIPLFNIVFFILLFALIFIARRKFKKLVAKIRDRNKTNREA
jgi:hypothetical protein